MKISKLFSIVLSKLEISDINNFNFNLFLNRIMLNENKKIEFYLNVIIFHKTKQKLNFSIKKKNFFNSEKNFK